MGTEGVKERKDVRVFIDKIKEISRSKRSVVLHLKRQYFGDPLLTVYFVKGRPLMANSFVVKRPWYAGILSEEEVEQAGGNLVSYAYEKLGNRLVEHLESYSKDVIDRVIKESVRNNWHLEVHTSDLKEKTVERLFGRGEEVVLKPEKEVGSLSVLSELSSIGITSVSFLNGGAPFTGGEPLLHLHRQVSTLGITGHYILFFPYVSVIHANLRNVGFVGEMAYGPNLSRAVSLVQDEAGVLPEFLKEYPWPTTGKGIWGRPLALYTRYMGKGVFVVFRSKSGGVYPCKLEMGTPEEVISEVVGMRDRVLSLVEEVLEKVKDRPKSILRVEVTKYVRSHPHPKDLLRELRIHFGI